MKKKSNVILVYEKEIQCYSGIWKRNPMLFLNHHHHHHHHHLSLKHLFLLSSARVKRSSRYEASPHNPEHCPFRMYDMYDIWKRNPMLFWYMKKKSNVTPMVYEREIQCYSGIWKRNPVLFWYMKKKSNVILVYEKEIQSYSQMPIKCEYHFGLSIRKHGRSLTE